MKAEAVFLGVVIGFVTCFLAIYAVGGMRTNGDMNRDGILNITDLSILASTINEQG